MPTIAGLPGAASAQLFGKRDETNPIREIAKAKVPILIVASGPLAQPAAQQLKSLLRRSVKGLPRQLETHPALKRFALKVDRFSGSKIVVDMAPRAR